MNLCDFQVSLMTSTCKITQNTQYSTLVEDISDLIDLKYDALEYSL